MPAKRYFVVSAALLFLSLGLLRPHPVLAQDDSCVDLCSASCIKPWSIPDRWDDVTGIPGYMGGQIGRGARPDWRSNQAFDFEPFIDLDENGRWDPGESFADDNGNGQYDAEAYHPSLTGYGARPVPGNFLSPSGDLGLALTLYAGNPSTSDPSRPGQYYSIDLPPINKGTPISGSDQYAWNIRNCNSTLLEKGDWLATEPSLLTGPTNQGMQELIAQDPDAEWDAATQTVINSNFELSPRVVFFTVHDPRIAIVSGRKQLQVVKIVAYFMERMTGQAMVQGRFVRALAPSGSGTPCIDGGAGGFIVDCPVPATESTWGRVKATYRD